MTVIVTGAANGIGLALTRELLRLGHAVIGADIDGAGLKALAEEYPDAALDTYVVDVGSHDDIDAFMDRVLAEHDEITGLVNNAGLYLGRPVGEYDDATIDQVIQVNVKGPVWLTRRFADHLVPRQRSGAVVNVASVAGEVGSSDALYGTVKAGVIGLTKSNAMNFAPLIRVNAVSPGLVVNTAIADRIPDYRYREYKRQERLTDDVLPEDVAAVITFLLGPGARTLTGAVVPVDNGTYPR